MHHTTCQNGVEFTKEIKILIKNLCMNVKVTMLGSY